MMLKLGISMILSVFGLSNLRATAAVIKTVTEAMRPMAPAVRLQALSVVKPMFVSMSTIAAGAVIAVMEPSILKKAACMLLVVLSELCTKSQIRHEKSSVRNPEKGNHYRIVDDFDHVCGVDAGKKKQCCDKYKCAEYNHEWNASSPACLHVIGQISHYGVENSINDSSECYY